MTSVDVRAPEQGAAPPDAGRPAWHLLLAGLLVLLALAGGLVLGRSTAGGVPRVVDPVDIGFAQDMKVHHAQAVLMSAVLHRRTTDPEVQALALDVMTTQQGQIGIMSGWLDLWGHTQTTSGPTMAWMGHDGGMPGMASADEIAALEALPPGELEEEFLRLMVRHHLGAVPMAAFAADRATSPDLVRLAGGMESGQAAEIELMQDMLVARGHDPEPVADHGTHD